MGLSSSALVLSRLLIIAYRRSGELSNPVLGGQMSLFKYIKVSGSGESRAELYMAEYLYPSPLYPWVFSLFW